MDHFVAYNKVAEYGIYKPKGNRFTHYSGKPRSYLERTIGQTLWVFSGVSVRGRMVYTLISRSQPDKIDGTLVRGLGEGFDPGIDVTGRPWFKALLEEQMNFRRGLNQTKLTPVIKALLALKTGAPQPALMAEEVSSGVKYIEGATRQITVNAYERNPQARTACITKLGCSCAVCGFDFGKVYGDIGRGFIHVHHIKDLATIRKSYVVHPVNDLVPVCPNCHAMLHTATPAMNVKKLQAIVKRRKMTI